MSIWNKKFSIFEKYYAEHKKRKSEELITLMPEFIIYLSMDIFNTVFDDIDNKVKEILRTLNLSGFQTSGESPSDVKILFDYHPKPSPFFSLKQSQWKK